MTAVERLKSLKSELVYQCLCKSDKLGQKLRKATMEVHKAEIVEWLRPRLLTHSSTYLQP